MFNLQNRQPSIQAFPFWRRERVDFLTSILYQRSKYKSCLLFRYKSFFTEQVSKTIDNIQYNSVAVYMLLVYAGTGLEMESSIECTTLEGHWSSVQWVAELKGKHADLVCR